MEQATTLLTKNLENAKASLEVLVADLQFLRDQVTITQVHSALTLMSDYNLGSVSLAINCLYILVVGFHLLQTCVAYAMQENDIALCPKQEIDL